MKKSGTLWRQLPLKARRAYESRAALASSARIAELHEQKESAKQALQEHIVKARHEKSVTRSRMVLSECKLSGDSLEILNRMYQDKNVTSRAVAALRAKASVAPPPPSELEQSMLESVPVWSPPEMDRPPWRRASRTT